MPEVTSQPVSLGPGGALNMQSTQREILTQHHLLALLPTSWERREGPTASAHGQPLGDPREHLAMTTDINSMV